jgi:hypothetical protein
VDLAEFPSHLRLVLMQEQIKKLPPPLRLPFNGELSPDERRMAEQCTFDGPASWEVEC